MAQFGMPGGWEIVAILVTILLLFVPGILVFGAGFLVGKKSAEKNAQAETQGSAPAETPNAEPTGQADTDGEADV